VCTSNGPAKWEATTRHLTLTGVFLTKNQDEATILAFGFEIPTLGNLAGSHML